MYEKYEKDIAVISMKLVSIILAIFALVIVINKELFISGISIFLLAIYFAAFAWSIIKKSNNLYFTLLTLIAFSLAYEVGVTLKLLFVLAIAFASFYYIHYQLINDKTHEN